MSLILYILSKQREILELLENRVFKIVYLKDILVII